MATKLLFFIFITLSFQQISLAQTYNESFREHLRLPHVTEVNSSTYVNHLLSRTTLRSEFDPYLYKRALGTASDIKQKYENLLASVNLPTVGCNTPEAYRYVRGLRTAARFLECMDYASTCEVAPSDSKQLLLAESAQCADKLNEFEAAYTLFSRATDNSMSQQKYIGVTTYRFAIFALNTQYTSEAISILMRNPNWGAGDANVMMSLIQYHEDGITNGYTTEFLDQKTLEFKKVDSEMASEMAMGWLNHLIWGQYDYLGAVKYLEQEFSLMNDPDRVFRLVELAFYGQDQINFQLTKYVLEAYYKYVNIYSRLPVEDNIYTVTEQYNQVCKTNLLQGAPFQKMQDLKVRWKSGEPIEIIINEAEQLDVAYPNKSDLLTLLGNLYETTQKDSQALNLYWKAHQLCNYNHRAHWGLGNVIKNARVKRYNDYQLNVQRMEKELSEAHFDTSVNSYIMNIKGVNADQLRGIKHSIRIWAAYLNSLVTAKTSLYIKQVYEYESEIPGYESDKDLRAEAPDNRLLDELRGRGGNPVITDLGETLRTIHGDYNLAAHEMAHSWHLDYAKVVRPEVAKCITKLYLGALQRNLFAEPYSKSHENEYFAQGVGYYLVRKDAPARFGITVQWLIDNDPDLYNFIVSIDKSNGFIKKVGCPVSLIN